MLGEKRSQSLFAPKASAEKAAATHITTGPDGRKKELPLYFGPDCPVSGNMGQNQHEAGVGEPQPADEPLRHAPADDGTGVEADPTDSVNMAEDLPRRSLNTESAGGYLDGDPGSLDYDEEWAAEDNKFRSITSFTASRASLRELRDYLADTLKYARIRAERQIKAGELPGGWFDPKDWDGWQKHMEGLIHRLDGVLALEGSTLELAHPPAPTVPELTM